MPFEHTRGDSVPQVNVNHATLELSVGDYVSAAPNIYSSREVDFEQKNSVLVANNIPLPKPVGDEQAWNVSEERGKEMAADRVISLNAYYARTLGPRFNWRMHGASIDLWASWMPRPLWRFASYPGGNWNFFHRDALTMLNQQREEVLRAESDGLRQLVPLMAYTGFSPQEIRREVGRAAWRRLSNNSPTRNMHLSRLAYRASRYGSRNVCASLSEVLEVKSGIARRASVLAGADCDLSDLKHASRISTVEDLDIVLDTIRDAKRMGAYNPGWSLRRLEREHEAASRRSILKDYSTEEFSPPLVVEVDGYRFSRLTSQADVASEGAAMRHCVASYAGDCSRGVYAVFKVEGKERATLGVNMDRNGRPHSLGQIYGACNSPVSDYCVSAAKDLLHDREFAHLWERAA